MGVYINMLKYVVFLFFLVFVNLTHTQILVDDVGDNWKLKVEESLTLIRQTDPVKYDTLIKYCNHITFWNGPFSTIEDSKTIMISQLDMNSNLTENISCVIIHELFHLKMFGKNMNINCEESEAYKFEIDFILKLQKKPHWLLLHATKLESDFKKQCE